MKQVALALAVMVAVSSPLFAKDVVKQQPAAPAAKARVVKPAERPVLDQFKTQSIAPASNQTGGNTPPRRERSGIEINPWVVPNFL